MIHRYDIAIPGGPRTSLSMGERRLLIATLRDALSTLLGDRYGSRHAKHQREDLDWLTSDDESDPFTYVRICGALGIDAGWLRNRVLAARAATSDDRPRLVVAPVEPVEDWTPTPPRSGRMVMTNEELVRAPIRVAIGPALWRPFLSLAAATLQDLGLRNATDLDGGFRAWVAHGLPVTRKEKP